MTQISVNGELIEIERLREETAAVAKLLQEQLPDEDPVTQRIKAREWAEENLIEELLLRQAAARGEHPPDPPKPTASELRAVYQSRRQNFRMPEIIHAAHIVCNIDEKKDEAAARAAIEHALAELAKGRPFAEVADELSDCPGNGGDLGFFPRGQMVDAFDAAVFPLSPGQTSGIFRTQFGFHIARMLEKHPEGIQPFEKVRESIEQMMLAERKQETLYAFVDNLKAKADIRRIKE